MTMWFQVKGSRGDDYRIEVMPAPDGFRITCTCPAGSSETACKHRFALLAGDGAAVHSSSHPVAHVAALLPGSRLEMEMADLKRLEAEAEGLKRAVSLAKKRVARAMSKG